MTWVVTASCKQSARGKTTAVTFSLLGSSSESLKSLLSKKKRKEKKSNDNTNLHTLSHTCKYTTHRFTTDSLMQLTSRMWISGLDKPRGS